MKFSDSKTDFGIELTVTLGLEFGISVLGGGKMLAACVGLSSQPVKPECAAKSIIYSLSYK